LPNAPAQSWGRKARRIELPAQTKERQLGVADQKLMSSREAKVMHATMRYYPGAVAQELADLLEKNQASVEAAMRTSPGFVSYTLVRLPDAVVSMTVCQDKAGTDESVRIAAAWIKEHGAGLNVSAPMVSEGTVLVQAK